MLVPDVIKRAKSRIFIRQNNGKHLYACVNITMEVLRVHMKCVYACSNVYDMYFGSVLLLIIAYGFAPYAAI